jgi:uncharacterized Zn-finger protein
MNYFYVYIALASMFSPTISSYAADSSKVKGWTCNSCYKSFIRASLLAAHERVHTGERPYSCPRCEKSYKQRNGLNYHCYASRNSCFPSLCKKERGSKRIKSEPEALLDNASQHVTEQAFSSEAWNVACWAEALAYKKLLKDKEKEFVHTKRFPVTMISQSDAKRLRAEIPLLPYKLFETQQQD